MPSNDYSDDQWGFVETIIAPVYQAKCLLCDWESGHRTKFADAREILFLHKAMVHD